jgi:uncharacterized protein (TIGR03663 family)
MQNEESKEPRLTTAKSFTSSFFIHNSAFVLIALLALVIRLPQLGDRPMHTDEAVNAYITGQLLAGEKYHYDPQDRHGPVLYLLAKPVAQLCGATNLADLTETELRLTTVIVGSATVLLFGAAVEMFGFLPCLIAALLFAVGPLPVYYSRYFIHETLFVAATFALLLCGWRAVKDNSIAFAALTGLCAALMLACKETAVIHFFALGLGVAICASVMKTKLPPVKLALTAFDSFIVATILLFTWFGQNWNALADLLDAVPNFAARAGGQGHEKPFSYYFTILDPLFVFSIVAAAGIYAVACDVVAGKRRAGLVLAVYGAVIFLIYSAIPYKTPWLALNFWLPLALLCSLGVEGVWQQFQKGTGRWVAGLGIAALVLVAGQQTPTLAFDYPADEKNPLAYAHTSDDILGLPVRIANIVHERKFSTRPRIAVVMKDAWPLPWYLRKFANVGYWQPGQTTGAADFFITPTDVDGKLAMQLKDFRPEFFGVRPNVLLILWTPLATNPATGASPPPRQP